jgi:hypothetical protein
MKDQANTIHVVRDISPQTQTNADTAIAGQIIDGAGYESVTRIIAYGAITDTDVTLVTLLEESDDSGMSGATAVADADMIGTEVGVTPLMSNDDTVYKLGYVGNKRYTKMTITPTGNNSGAVSVSSVAVLSNARHQPAGVAQTP